MIGISVNSNQNALKDTLEKYQGYIRYRKETPRLNGGVKLHISNHLLFVI